MSTSILDTIDFSPADEPLPSGDLRSDLLNWLHYQRHEFMRKLRDLTPTGLAKRSVPPVELSVLGLVRHMRQMEHSYLAWGMGGGEHTDFYGDEDYAGGSPETVEDDVRGYLTEVECSDAALDGHQEIASMGRGHGRPLGFILLKMLDEYALHSGQAHMIRFASLGELRR